jgi:transcriptional regulator with XRE-family HTH domain
VGDRVRTLRLSRGLTLAAVSAATGISISTLSRFESGRRRASLELLLPLASVYGVPLDDLVGAPPTGDPRIHIRPLVLDGMTMLRLSNTPGLVQAYKIVVPAGPSTGVPQLRTHEGHDWMLVLSGQLRLIVGEADLLLSSGEAIEFDARTPHWFGSGNEGSVELLTLFGRQGQRVRLRSAELPHG